MEMPKVKHYVVKETGDPEVDRTDVVDRGWGQLWMDFSKFSYCYSFRILMCSQQLQGNSRKCFPSSIVSPCIRPPPCVKVCFEGLPGVDGRSDFKTLDLPRRSSK